jgi:sugar phosphate isomerase/epimerase
MELVLFDTPTASNLPDAATVGALARLATRTAGFTYTVHLPADVGPAETAPLLLDVARRTRPLEPVGTIVHLSDPTGGTGLVDAPAQAAWLDTVRRRLDELAEVVGGHEYLCVENVEGWPPELFHSLLDELPLSLCIDIGHFWRTRRDPVPYLQTHLPRTRIVHLHGCDENGVDHQALSATPPAQLRLALAELQHFAGVLTLEVFGQPHFRNSREVLEQTWRTLTNGNGKG